MNSLVVHTFSIEYLHGAPVPGESEPNRCDTRVVSPPDRPLWGSAGWPLNRVI